MANFVTDRATIQRVAEYPDLAKTSAKGTRCLRLTNSNQKALVDACYYDALRKFQWSLFKGGTKSYVRTSTRPNYLLHRLLLRAKEGVDAITRMEKL